MDANDPRRQNLPFPGHDAAVAWHNGAGAVAQRDQLDAMLEQIARITSRAKMGLLTPADVRNLLAEI